MVLFLVQHPVGCFFIDVAFKKLVGDDSFVVLPEFCSVVGDLEEAEEGLVHFPLAFVGAPGRVLRNGLVFSDELQSQHLVKGEGVEHHGLLSQEVELPFGPLEDRIHPGDKLKFCEIKILDFPFEVLSLGRLVHLDRLLGFAFLGGFLHGVEVLLPPGHVVEDAVGDGVDGIHPVAIYFVVVLKGGAVLLPVVFVQHRILVNSFLPVVNPEKA